MRRLTKTGLRDLALLAAVLVVTAPVSPTRGQAAATRDDIVGQLSRFETAPELDNAALRQKTLERSRIRSRTEPPPDKRTPIAPEFQNLPGFNVDIQFDTDTPIVRPQSYETLGRIADALVHATLLPYSFLIVGHIEANGKRESNVILSQRRADAIRDILVNTFKISAKRIQAIGLGEEQLLDPPHPTAAANQQIQILTVAKVAEQSEAPAAAPATSAPPAKKKPARKR
jgi:outer membrane protein OmpA-like peptidoglycan-associated protein